MAIKEIGMPLLNGLNEYTLTTTGGGVSLAGIGNNGKFKATGNVTVASFTVNGETYTVKQGEENEIELISGCWYPFILDRAVKTVNFNLGGGAGINFKVIGGTTQPTNPPNNTVWVNTGTAITAKYISPNAPTSPVAGAVWIRTTGYANTNNASFVVDKKAQLTVTPCLVSQYINNTWVPKNSKVYKNSAWVDINFMLLNGSINVDKWKANGTSSTGKVNIGPSSITVSANGGDYVGGGGSIATVEKIDMTGINQIIVNCSKYGRKDFSLSVSVGGKSASSSAPNHSSYTTDSLTTILDVSALTGLHTISITVNLGYYYDAETATINKVDLL